jgi:hypothetical protein
LFILLSCINKSVISGERYVDAVPNLE